MELFGLIGHPLGHSFSKTYFTEKFAALKLDCNYVNFDLVDLTQIKDLLRVHPNLKGFNVTIPYKEAIIPYLDEIDPIAEHVGAVNTVKVLPDARLKGFNTDIIGFDCVIANIHDKVLQGLILGTGGASKAVQYVLERNQIPFQVVSRNHRKGDYTYESLTDDAIQSHLLIINTTPVGMFPNVERFPPIPYEAIHQQHILIDLIYNPEETLFLRKGKEKGAITCNGLTMLHAQAEASWTLWTKT